MACAISASMLGRRPAMKLGEGLRPSWAATDWKAVTEMLCNLSLGSCSNSTPWFIHSFSTFLPPGTLTRSPV